MTNIVTEHIYRKCSASCHLVSDCLFHFLVLLPLLRCILDDLPALTKRLTIEPHLDAVDVVINTTPATNEMLGNPNAGEEVDSHFSSPLPL